MQHGELELHRGKFVAMTAATDGLHLATKESSSLKKGDSTPPSLGDLNSLGSGPAHEDLLSSSHEGLRQKGPQGVRVRLRQRARPPLVRDVRGRHLDRLVELRPPAAQAQGAHHRVHTDSVPSAGRRHVRKICMEVEADRQMAQQAGHVDELHSPTSVHISADAHDSKQQRGRHAHMVHTASTTALAIVRRWALGAGGGDPEVMSLAETSKSASWPIVPRLQPPTAGESMRPFARSRPNSSLTSAMSNGTVRRGAEEMVSSSHLAMPSTVAL